MTIAIEDFKHLKSYTKLIENKLISDLWQMIYKPMFKDLNIKSKNARSLIVDALENGEIYYVDGGFKARKTFSNAVSIELIRLGAKYNSITRIFEIPRELLSNEIIKCINDNLFRAQTKLNIINSYLYDIELNLDQIIDNMFFNEEVITVISEVGEQIHKNAKRINVIEPELTLEQKKQIASDYTYNMKYYIKNWVQERIPEMRLKVQKAILEGYREEQVQQMLEKEYGIAKRKAKFLAHNETAIMLAELKKSMYTQMGFEEFIWQTVLEGRERPLHYELHGKVFRFDNPPIIDEKTGQKGLPGETYNCRCNLIPIKRDSVFYNQSMIDEFANLRNYDGIMKYGPNK